MIQILPFVIFVIVCVVTMVWCRFHPQHRQRVRPILPYLYVFMALGFGRLAAEASPPQWWRFGPPVALLICAAIELIRQRRAQSLAGTDEKASS